MGCRPVVTPAGGCNAGRSYVKVHCINSSKAYRIYVIKARSRNNDFTTYGPLSVG
jgi:hypothetical protein